MYVEKYERDKERFSGDKMAWGQDIQVTIHLVVMVTTDLFGEYLFLCTFIYRQTQHRLQGSNLLIGNWAECRVILWFLNVQTKYTDKVKLSSINILFFGTKIFPSVTLQSLQVPHCWCGSGDTTLPADTVRRCGGGDDAHCLLLKEMLGHFLMWPVQCGVVGRTGDAPLLCAVKPLTTDWLAGLSRSQPRTLPTFRVLCRKSINVQGFLYICKYSFICT